MISLDVVLFSLWLFMAPNFCLQILIADWQSISIPIFFCFDFFIFDFFKKCVNTINRTVSFSQVQKILWYANSQKPHKRSNSPQQSGLHNFRQIEHTHIKWQVNYRRKWHVFKCHLLGNISLELPTYFCQKCGGSLA